MTDTDETEVLHKLEGHVITLEWAVGVLLALRLAPDADGREAFLKKIAQLTLEDDAPDAVRRGFDDAKDALTKPLRDMGDDALQALQDAGLTVTIRVG